MNELFHLKRLYEDQIEAASKVLAHAFQDDLLFVYCFPDLKEREKKANIHCEWLILTGILSGELYTSSDIKAVSVWNPYKIKSYPVEKQTKNIIRRLRKVRRELFSDEIYKERLSIFEEIANLFQIEHVHFPHWYLAIIGVEPTHQGKSYGSKLIRLKLAEIDELNLPCYLHTENEKNAKFYEQFGFEPIGKNKIPNFNVYHHPMLRNKKQKA